ncbi:ArnT family glycosyltransferase [Priestia koreensis]|uniref:ArnT family glycosyltransferase n=1 Tax=Priestia koreensis TaxID=284581 RepID=UPI00203EA89F|nr:glycosyltransferase family 39 protein [Priestia koreensis]MCM3005104.1 glycosyltransferase family 39 protein [Priestia koreensis]
MKQAKTRRFDFVLILIMLIAAFLNIFNIWKDDYVNPYYTAAVKSMLQSFHNFFFASFDPAGYVTVDKPPVVFWIQTVSAYIFGFHGWSVILPQALAGVGSVLLIYLLVKPSFGKTAARLSSLVMACTPIVAAVSRTNNIDSMLVFTLLVATWLLFKATKKGKLMWLLASFAVVGIGFNMKMLQAYMILPAFYLFYVLATKINWKKKLGFLTTATAVLLAVSISWALVVDAIPADKRPYMGSSQTNSVLELAFGYNGVSRLTGQNGPGGGGNMPNAKQMQKMMENGNAPQGMPGNLTKAQQKEMQKQMEKQGMTPPQMPGGNNNQAGNPPQMSGENGKGTPPQMGKQSGGMFGTGTPGALRLFKTGLSEQISWVLPFAIIAAIGFLSTFRRKQKLKRKQKESLFWMAWLVPIAGFFSVAGFFHQYYLIMLAPAISVLVGAGWTTLMQMYRNREGWRAWLLPAGLLGTTIFQLYMLMPTVDTIGKGLIIGVGVAGILLSAVLLFKKERKNRASFFVSLAALFVLLVAPLFWAATPIIYGGNSMLPEAGPTSSTAGGMGRGMLGGQTDAKTITYLTEHNTGEKYLFATTDSNTASPYIIETGKAVMAMGGFSGSDPIMTVSKLKKMVANGEVKYFLLSSDGRGKAGNSDVLNWITKNGKEISSSKWQSTKTSSPMGGSLKLYEIQ